MAGLKLLVLAFLILSLGMPCWGESTLSFRGIGLMDEGTDARSRGMGGAHLSVGDGQGFSLGNPATVGRLTRTSIAVGFLGEQVRAEMDWGGEGRLLAGNLSLFRLVLPLAYGTVVSVGLFPYSRVDFDLAENVEGAIAYHQRIEGIGGLRLVSIALGRPIGEHLLIGGEFRSFFGAIVETWTRDFEEPALLDTRDVFTRAHRGHTWGGGVTIRFTEGLSASATYVLKTTLNVETMLESVSGGTWSEQEDRGLPTEMGFGIAWRPMASLLIALDGTRTFWDGRSGADRDGLQLSIGAEYMRSRKPEASYLYHIPLRIGIKWRALPYEIGVPRSGINERFLSVGIGFPLRGGRGIVDVALEIGQRGHLEQHGLRETVVRQAISFSGWERWFERRHKSR